MWWYNIHRDNEGSISHILRLGSTAAGSILLTYNLVALKRENSEPILTVKRTGPVASNHGNLYIKLLSLVLGRYGLPHANVNGTE